MERNDGRGAVRFTRYEAAFVVHFIQGMIKEQMGVTIMPIGVVKKKMVFRPKRGGGERGVTGCGSPRRILHCFIKICLGFAFFTSSLAHSQLPHPNAAERYTVFPYSNSFRHRHDKESWNNDEGVNKRRRRIRFVPSASTARVLLPWENIRGGGRDEE